LIASNSPVRRAKNRAATRRELCGKPQKGGEEDYNYSRSDYLVVYNG
jgi:hypothetical protein